MIKTNYVIDKTLCYHCGDECLSASHLFDDKHFCCHGCKSVYQILSSNNLCNYYAYNSHPGETRVRTDKRFDYLNDAGIVADLIDYTDEHITTVTFYIPHIHCSSCLWLLEQLNKLNPAIHYSRVDFLKKQVNLRFDHHKISLRETVELLFDIGYEPLISLQDVVKEQNNVVKDNIVQKIAVAGFCFGNVMLLSFPEYFGITVHEQSFKHFFGWLNILFSLPVVFYSGAGYFVSAYQNLRNKVLNIDFPLALGIAVLFIRTAFEVISNTGAGFADTLCGLVFFLLIGKFVQKKTYYHISFERDYRSFFPVAVHIIDEGRERPIPLSQLQTGQRIVVRNNEIIPADAILLKGEALIDFSFVTGEAIPVHKVLGEVVYAGGRQTGQVIELEVIKRVSQSYLTQLWNNEVFKNNNSNRIQTFNERVSKYFSVVLLLIAFGALIFWLRTDVNTGVAAFTAVLIVACPCALALSTPFTMSAALSIFDRNLLYLKNTAVVEQMACIDAIVMDKTGTITLGGGDKIKIDTALTLLQRQLIYSACINSIHPLSRHICNYLDGIVPLDVSGFSEIAGQGIIASVGGHQLLIGSSKLVLNKAEHLNEATSVHISIDGRYIGCFSFTHSYRTGMDNVSALDGQYRLYLLSGDNDHERAELSRFFHDGSSMIFNQSPQDKLNFVDSLQANGTKVMMLGDGLNDSGALKQSDLGIAVTDNVNNFSPGSDGILDGRSFNKLPAFLSFSKDAVNVIHFSFLISLAYNIVGLSYAVTGHLSPLVAAILMPMSTVTIISFTSIATHVCAKNRKLL